MASLIAGKIRPAMAARLEDTLYGYNACVQPFAGQLGVTIPVMDYSTPTHFFQAQCDPELLEDGTPFDFPLQLLYSVSSDNYKPIQKYQEFAGSVSMALEVIHSWNLDSIDPAIFENTGDCVEAAMYQVFNSLSAPAWTPPGVLYVGLMKQVRHQVTAGGLGLLMRQVFTLTFTDLV